MFGDNDYLQVSLCPYKDMVTSTQPSGSCEEMSLCPHKLMFIPACIRIWLGGKINVVHLIYKSMSTQKHADKHTI